MMATSPKMPVPNNANDDGSGTVLLATATGMLFVGLCEKVSANVVPFAFKLTVAPGLMVSVAPFWIAKPAFRFNVPEFTIVPPV